MYITKNTLSHISRLFLALAIVLTVLFSSLYPPGVAHTATLTVNSTADNTTD